MSTMNPPPAAIPGDRVLRPLTQSTKKGKQYARFPDVEEEIRRMLGLDPASWDPEGLKSETLVFLIRSLVREPARHNVLGRLFDHLGRRVVVITRDYTAMLPRAVRDEVEDQVRSRIVELLFTDKATRGSEFLEIAFREKVDALALNELRRAKRQLRSRQFGTLDPGPESGARADLDQSVEVPDHRPGPEDELLEREVRELLNKGLDAITDNRHRQAILLRFEHGWQIRDNDPSTPTLSTHFDVSPRQIQNWIKTAVSEMRKAMGDES
jgi:hypothetical protein